MCTAATYKTKDFYFGRTLDYDFTYGDEVTVTPRRFPFRFRYREPLESHYAMIGMAHVADGYPLYYEAVNEKGLGVAGLNFVGNACYFEVTEGKLNLVLHELIPFVLGTCASVREARAALADLNLVNEPFSPQFPVSSLHWMIADRDEVIVMESTASGLHIYDNPAGVLTNNPTFPEQMLRLTDYMHLSPKQPENLFSDQLQFNPYSRGMGALGLPGDVSSPSRFVKVAFTKLNSLSGDSEAESVGQFFHILGSVEQQRGVCEVGEGKYEITVYTSCANCDKGIYYYTTYSNRQITAVDMHRTDLDGADLSRYPLVLEEQIAYQN